MAFRPRERGNASNDLRSRSRERLREEPPCDRERRERRRPARGAKPSDAVSENLNENAVSASAVDAKG